MKTKLLAALLAATLVAVAPSHAQVILAGYYAFPAPNSSGETTPLSANFLAPGVAATIVGGDGSRSTWSSTDGTYGSFASTGAGDTASLAPPDQVVNGAFTIRGIEDDEVVTFTITNTGAFDLTLASFVYDIRPFTNTDATQLTFIYLSGDLDDADGTTIGDSPVFGTVTNNAAGQVSDYLDSSFNIATALTDKTLSTGQSATFTLNITTDNSASVPAALDNMAFTGTIVPEPSTTLLLGGGLMTMLALRRRRF